MKALCTFIIATALLGLCACSSDPDLQYLRNAVGTMSVAAENHNADGILAYIDNSYRGTGGNRAGVANLLQRHFSYNKSINLIISDIEINIAEDKQSARVNVRVLMTGGQGKLPERGRLSAIRSHWKKFNDEWRVVDANWQPVLISL